MSIEIYAVVPWSGQRLPATCRKRRGVEALVGTVSPVTEIVLRWRCQMELRTLARRWHAPCPLFDRQEGPAESEEAPKRGRKRKGAGER